MSRVEEIEDAIDRLPPEEFRRIVCWVMERDRERWHEQTDRDAASGKPDVLLKEADKESQ